MEKRDYLLARLLLVVKIFFLNYRLLALYGIYSIITEHYLQVCKYSPVVLLQIETVRRHTILLHVTTRSSGYYHVIGCLPCATTIYIPCAHSSQSIVVRRERERSRSRRQGFGRAMCRRVNLRIARQKELLFFFIGTLVKATFVKSSTKLSRPLKVEDMAVSYLLLKW